MAWRRLFAVIAVGAAGSWGAYVALVSPHTPRWLLAFSGLMALCAAAAFVVLAAFLYQVIVEDVRPSLRLRKPVVPLALSHKEATFVGRVRLRQHPVRFWGALTLNNRFMFGFMVFGEPEYLDLLDDQAPR